MSKITLVELPIYDKMLPLTAGYLQAYACKDAAIQETYTFDKYSTGVKTAEEKIWQRLEDADSDIYTFSCYVWNIQLIQRLVSRLVSEKPQAKIILGGPQVMHHQAKYLSPEFENVFICNGEGEKTFQDFLRVANQPESANYETVRGLSFYKDGELITTPAQERIASLDEIPSPFLNDLFDDFYQAAVIESNRGCPFHCGFCYWGAATNDKVYKFSEDRVRDELEWLSKKNVPFYIIADANWGMLRRDIELSQHIAENKRKYQHPKTVYYSAAKNQPSKVSQITEIFDSVGIIATQPVSMQTLNPASLEQIKRQNIKLSAYSEIHEMMQDKGISTVTELIWPLPGETLDTFGGGINQLCVSKAGTLIVYPHLLLHNTPLYHQQTEFGFVTKAMDPELGEAELIVETSDVRYDEYIAGLQFYFAVHVLHNMATLPLLSDYLAAHKEIDYQTLFWKFVDFLKEQERCYTVELYEKSAMEDAFYEYAVYGKIAHALLHQERAHFVNLLADFVSTQAWWDDTNAQVAFELDLLNQPYLYSDTTFYFEPSLFHHLHVESNAKDRTYSVEIPQQYLSIVQELMPNLEMAAGNQFGVSHKRAQYPTFGFRLDMEQMASYCHGMLMRIKSIMPKWEAAQPQLERVIA